MHTKKALSNLKNRYIAVLKKCALLNVFGSLAFATMLTSPFIATEALASGMIASFSNPVLNNLGTLTGNEYTIPTQLSKSAMYGSHTTGSINYIFKNYGNIDIDLISNSSSSSLSSSTTRLQSYAMFAEGNGNHTLFNYGNINVRTIEGNANLPSLNNISSEAMSVSALGNHILNNYGTLNSLAQGSTSSTKQDIYSYAMYGSLGSFSMNNFNVINSTAIAGINDSAVAFGMNATSLSSGNHSLSNYGTINVSSSNAAGLFSNIAYGMYANAKGNHDLSNYGTLNVTASAGTGKDYARANVHGMYVAGDGEHTLNNSGIINVSAIAGKTSSSGPSNTNVLAYGMYVYNPSDNANSSLSNSNALYVTAIGGTANGGITTANSTAYGMLVYARGTHDLSNTGSIDVRATGGKATSTLGSAEANAEAYGMSIASTTGSSTHTLSNSGIINVTALGGIATTSASSTTTADATAYGIYLETFGTTTLNNTGIINASASVQSAGASAKAFEIYSQRNYNIGTWATTLRDWSANDAVFGNTASVTFDNSSFILRPGTVTQGFALGKEYTLANMVSINDVLQASGSANVSGTIKEVKTEVPFLTATINGTNANTATVKLEANINEDNTTGKASMQHAISQVQNQFTNISNSLRTNLVKVYTDANLIAQNEHVGMAAGSDMQAQNKWQIFLTPYISRLDNSDNDFAGNNSGIVGGLTYNVSDVFAIGGHLDFNAGNYSADTYNMEVDSTTFALGVHANYKIKPEWYVRGQLTASLGENESDYAISPLLVAQSEYANKALYAEIATGYTLKFGKSHFLTPELGISYLSANIDDYDIEWNVSGYNMHYASSSYNALFASFNLDWNSSWNFGENKELSLLAGLGIRQKLASDDIESKLTFFNTDFITKNSEDNTVFLADLGLEYDINDLSFSLNYSGEYGSNQEVHRGYVAFKYVF